MIRYSRNVFCVVYTAEQNKSGHFCDFAYAIIVRVVGRFK